MPSASRTCTSGRSTASRGPEDPSSLSMSFRRVRRAVRAQARVTSGHAVSQPAPSTFTVAPPGDRLDGLRGADQELVRERGLARQQDVARIASGLGADGLVERSAPQDHEPTAAPLRTSVIVGHASTGRRFHGAGSGRRTRGAGASRKARSPRSAPGPGDPGGPRPARWHRSAGRPRSESRARGRSRPVGARWVSLRSRPGPRSWLKAVSITVRTSAQASATRPSSYRTTDLRSLTTTCFRVNARDIMGRRLEVARNDQDDPPGSHRRSERRDRPLPGPAGSGSKVGGGGRGASSSRSSSRRASTTCASSRSASGERKGRPSTR